MPSDNSSGALLKRYAAPALLLLLFAWIAIITAWLCDDSFISLRQVSNAIHGHGFTWNYGQRVQAFTHPSWALLLTLLSSVTRELYLTAIAASVFLSVASVYFVLRYGLLQREARFDTVFIYLVVVALAFSKAFTDYMTSGLENPLSYFLIGLAIWQAGKLLASGENDDKLWIVFVLLALAFLNRFDYALLLFPLALYLFVTRAKPQAYKAVVPGAVLIASWLSFSLFYFGSPLPNTFYAKLASGYPTSELQARGYAYFVVTLERDPLTIALVALGIIAGFMGKRGLNASLSIGLVLYCAYIFNAGGDFMQGRYFAVPAYVSMFNLISVTGTRAGSLVPRVAFLAVMLIAAVAGEKPILSDTSYGEPQFGRGVADERGVWYAPYGLLSPHRNWPEVSAPATRKPREFETTCAGAPGLTRSDVFLIDHCGLTDALLSRLPAIRLENWRIGHHFRKVPTNYGDFLIGRAPAIEDAELQDLVDDVQLAVSGPLFAAGRLGAIVRLNGGASYDFDREKYADPAVYIPASSYPVQREYAELNQRGMADGTPWYIDGVTIFYSTLMVRVQPSRPVKWITLSLDCDAEYELTLNNNESQTSIDSACPGVRGGGLVTRTIELPEPVSVWMVKLEAVPGDGWYSLGHLLLEGEE